VRQTPYADTVDRLASALGLSAIERKTLVAAARVRRSDASERRLPPTDLVTNTALYRRVFVGREAELRELRAVCDRVLGGSGELALVVGEPGIGKTAVCGQLADYAGSRGMATLVGHLYEEGFSSLPYLPFVEALREYVLHGSVDELRKQLGHLAPEVGRLLPEVCQKLHVEPRPTRDPEEDRWRLLTAVTEFLQAATRHRPLMLLLEDVQWADRGTLDLLLFLSRRLAGSRLLLVCTYRDVEVDRAHPLAGALAELRRGPEFTRVLIRGLDTNDVSQILMHLLVGGDVDVAFADAVQRQTEGNPLFVQEVARYLVEEGVMYQSDGQSLGATTASLMTRVPEGVREVIGKRLSKLSPECNQALSAAAVIGREFGLGILQQVIDLKEDVLLETLEHAQRARVLDDTSIEGEVRFRFNHALFRQTLYEELFTPRRGASPSARRPRIGGAIRFASGRVCSRAK
jgi:predicted ATPase